MRQTWTHKQSYSFVYILQYHVQVFTLFLKLLLSNTLSKYIFQIHQISFPSLSSVLPLSININAQLRVKKHKKKKLQFCFTKAFFRRVPFYSSIYPTSNSNIVDLCLDILVQPVVIVYNKLCVEVCVEICVERLIEHCIGLLSME